MQLGW